MRLLPPTNRPSHCYQFEHDKPTRQHHHHVLDHLHVVIRILWRSIRYGGPLITTDINVPPSCAHHNSATLRPRQQR